MQILGLCNGSVNGNSEILLKAALKAATVTDSSISVSWIRVPTVALPRQHLPFRDDPSVIPHRNDGEEYRPRYSETDDREVVFEAIMDADAIIIASPVYSHQPAGTLKALVDAILGPYADVCMAYDLKRRQEEGDESVKDVKLDPRDFKPRVAGFIAVAGSDPKFPEQWTMALPTMQTCLYPIHSRVVDQVVLSGYASQGAVLTDSGAAVERAELLGRRVASQMGKPYDEAQYLGPEESGSCPYCHLLKIEFREGNKVVCIVCGANGILELRPGGNIRPKWEEDSTVSCLTLKGKLQHRYDVRDKMSLEKPKLASISLAFAKWKSLEFPRVPLPSLQEKLRGRL
ncbi:putative nadph-dependent fmn reductase protein [Fusarium bulbicola]|nr:putative nadph-dependent fmn reductase protein [Fusarium bulbicola]